MTEETLKWATEAALTYSLYLDLCRFVSRSFSLLLGWVTTHYIYPTYIYI